MAEKDVDRLLRKGAKPVDPRVVLWTPAEITDFERATVASVAAHLLVAEEHRESPLAKEATREFRKDSPRIFSIIVDLYSRGVVKTSRTSLDVSLVGGVEGAFTRMASAAMDTCYQARDIDFGNRKFDAVSAVKLINGLVKLDQSVTASATNERFCDQFACTKCFEIPSAGGRTRSFKRLTLNVARRVESGVPRTREVALLRQKQRVSKKP